MINIGVVVVFDGSTVVVVFDGSTVSILHSEPYDAQSIHFYTQTPTTGVTSHVFLAFSIQKKLNTKINPTVWKIAKYVIKYISFFPDDDYCGSK